MPAKKKPVTRKVVRVKKLNKVVAKPKAVKAARVQTGTGWKRMMLKAKAKKA